MDLIEKAYSCTKIGISFSVAVIYGVLLVSYQHCIQGLEKPAGVYEALTFLVKYPKEYCGALTLGLLIHIVCICVIASILLCFVGIVTLRITFNIAMVVNLVLAIVMITLNNLYAKYVTALVLALVVVIGAAWALVNADN